MLNIIKIDFHGSTHGHFLEYVSNVYIMQTPPSKLSIFKPPTYSAHAPDKNYLNNRQIKCGHFSSQQQIENTDTVIRIIMPKNNNNMFFIALTNLLCKAGDVGFEKQLLSVSEPIRNNPVEYRNSWYSKFNNQDEYVPYYKDFPKISNQIFDFPFEAFFSFNDFCIALTDLSNFLSQAFFPDQSLYHLWKTFIQYNQGWQSFKKCNYLINDIFSNSDTEINCTIVEQGWINFNLSKMCKLYQGPPFDNIDYPVNTSLIYDVIKEHVNSLR